MKQPPLVSIIVTNYNYGAYVAAAIESALAQPYSPIEVLVVDDGSTDNSRAILNRYRDRVDLLFATNGGQAAAMNRGFARSRGEFVLFLDADDMLEPDAIERVVAAWQEGDSKIQFLMRGVDAEGRELGFCFPGAGMLSGDVRRLTELTGSYPSPPTSGNVFTRAMLEQVMPIPEQPWRRCADTYLIFCAAFCGNVRSIDACLGRFRLHGANDWVTDKVDAARLGGYLAVDGVKEGLARRYTQHPKATLLHWQDHLQARLASLRLDAGAHPFPGDRATRLAWAGVTASLKHPTNSAGKRVLSALWFVAVATLPRAPALRAIDLGYAPGNRPLWLKRLLRGSTAS